MTPIDDKPEKAPRIDQGEYSSILEEIFENEAHDEEAPAVPGTEDGSEGQQHHIRIRSRKSVLTGALIMLTILETILAIMLFCLTLLEPATVPVLESQSVVLRSLGPDARFFMAFKKVADCLSSGTHCSRINAVLREYNQALRDKDDGFPTNYHGEDFSYSGFVTTNSQGVIYQEEKER